MVRRTLRSGQGGGLLDRLDGVEPAVRARKIDRDPSEFGNARRALFDVQTTIVMDRDQRHRLAARLVDVAPLRHAGHDDRGAAIVLAALVNMAERPIVEAGRLEIDKPARSIDIMTGRAVEAGVHQADIDPIGKRRAKLGQQALGRLRSRKAQAMNGDGKTAALDLNDLGATGKHLHRRRQDEFLGDARQGIMIAADDIDGDTGLSKPLHLTGQKPRGLHRRLVAIIEIAGNHQRIDLFGEAQIDDGHERLARGVTNQVGERAVAQGQRAQWRIEVNIGGVNEAESHQRFILFLVIAVNPLIEAVGPAVTHRI